MENKALREMSHDEIAQLNPEQFKELATAHNDHLERSEQAYQWPIDVARTLTDKELENRRSSLEIKQMVDEDFKDQGLYAADPFNVSHERTLNAVVDEQVRRYVEKRDHTRELSFPEKPEREPRLPMDIPADRGSIAPGADPSANHAPIEQKYNAWHYETNVAAPMEERRQQEERRELSFPEKLEAEQRAKGQTLADLAPKHDREQEREIDNDRW